MSRKQHTYHYIYKTTCLITGRYYVGMHSTSNLEDGYLGSGKRLKYSLNKYGIENHKIEIIEWDSTRNLLRIREQELVTEELLKDPLCMNLNIGGLGGFSSAIQSELGKRSNIKRWKDPEYIKKHKRISSNTFIRLHREGKIKRFDWTGSKHNEKTKKKIGESNSISQKGNKNSQFGTMWITNGKESIKIKKDQVIPNGWIKGRKITPVIQSQ